MKVQVRNRLQRWRYTSIGAFLSVFSFVLFGLTLLLPQTSVEAAGADIKAIEGQRQFDVIVFKLKNIEEKIPTLKGARASWSQKIQAKRPSQPLEVYSKKSKAMKNSSFSNFEVMLCEVQSS